MGWYGDRKYSDNQRTRGGEVGHGGVQVRGVGCDYLLGGSVSWPLVNSADVEDVEMEITFITAGTRGCLSPFFSCLP